MPVRAVPRLAFVGWFVVSAGGCAAISGLDSIQEEECAPLCGDAQAGKDSTAADAPGVDTSTSPDTSTAADTSSGSDTGSVVDSTSPPVDAPSEVGPTDASEASTKDGGTDGAVDGGEDGSPDAPFDSGCGPLNTTTNCSACGDKCAPTSTSVTSASCGGDSNGFGATCSYTCATGYLDCNGATNPPDLDGCECHVPGATQSQCCATSGGDCPVQHKNGLGQSTSLFYDCVPAGTINSQLANDACIAYVGAANAADCQPYYASEDAAAPDSWCSGAATGDCICWTFLGQYSGTVCDAKAAGAPDPTQCYFAPTTGTFN